jgi:hypothetical protein
MRRGWYAILLFLSPIPAALAQSEGQARELAVLAPPEIAGVYPAGSP